MPNTLKDVLAQVKVHIDEALKAFEEGGDPALQQFLARRKPIASSNDGCSNSGCGDSGCG
jgi:hypothetical protein